MRVALVLAGTGLMLVGAWGSVFGEDAAPLRVAALLLAAALVHDLVLAPAVALVGLVVRRLPRRLRSPVQVGLIVGAVVVLVSVPVVGRFGARADNPSLLPRDYGHGLALVLALVVVGVLVGIVVRVLTHGREDGACTPDA